MRDVLKKFKNVRTAFDGTVKMIRDACFKVMGHVMHILLWETQLCIVIAHYRPPYEAEWVLLKPYILHG